MDSDGETQSSVEVELPNEWWLCDDKDWLQHANLLFKADDCIITLRIMSLDRKMDGILSSMRDAERQQKDTTALSLEYQEAMSQKKHLKSKEGHMEFHDKHLQKSYEDWKDRRDALPL